MCSKYTVNYHVDRRKACFGTGTMFHQYQSHILSFHMKMFLNSQILVSCNVITSLISKWRVMQLKVMENK